MESESSNNYLTIPLILEEEFELCWKEIYKEITYNIIKQIERKQNKEILNGKLEFKKFQD